MIFQKAPGPWKWRAVYNDDGRKIGLLLETLHRPVPCNDPLVTAIREDVFKCGDLHFEDSPNGKLIEASPSLLSYLEMLVDMHDNQVFICGKDDEPMVQSVLAHAREQINKLRGNIGRPDPTDEWYLLAPGQWKNSLGPEDWWAIAHDNLGIIAYVMNETFAGEVLEGLRRLRYRPVE